jgi:site-specific recombinase XerC
MGSIFRQAYTVPGKDGSRVKRLSRKWYVEYTDPNGKRHRVPGYTDRAATEALLGRLEQEAARVAAGLLPSGFGLARKPLGELLAEYIEHLRGKGNGDAHVQLVEARCKAVLEGAALRQWNEIAPAKVSTYLADRRAKGLAIRTSNHYLTQFRGFVAWLAGRIQVFDPLTTLKPLNAETDRRHLRRSLSAELFMTLLTTTEKSAVVIEGFTGQQRAMLYLLAGYSGLRASELASLTPESFHLATWPPIVIVEAGYSKHRRQDEVPIPTIAPQVRAWLEGKPAGERLWPGTWAFHKHAAAMLRADLTAAKIPYAERGRVFDFHSLRCQFITGLARSGAGLVETQKLARHSDPRLTASTYSHLELRDLAGAAEKLPEAPGLLQTDNSSARRNGANPGRKRRPA